MLRPPFQYTCNGGDNGGGGHFLNSNRSPGWQSKALQIASRVESRMALALPFLSMEMFAMVIPTFSVSSVTLIFRLANMTSIFIIIAIVCSFILMLDSGWPALEDSLVASGMTGERLGFSHPRECGDPHRLISRQPESNEGDLVPRWYSVAGFPPARE